MGHKAGFVNIIGNPNVGKSTLMNSLVGEKLSIVTQKAQTTRHRIMGIVNGEDFQVVYSDTPGILKPSYKLQNSMMEFVMTALSDADLLIYVTDVVETVDKNPEIMAMLSQSSTPIIALINKIDLSTQEEVFKLMEKIRQLLPSAEVIPVSALKGFNLDKLVDQIRERLPENPPFFPKDELTDRTMRFFVSEIIREKIFMNYQKEIPYSTEVEIEEYKELENIDHIRAVIHVLRDSQKGIIIGHQGKSIKKVGTQARKDIEAFTGKKAFLEIFVKVSDDWRDKPERLRQFGYL